MLALFQMVALAMFRVPASRRHGKQLLNYTSRCMLSTSACALALESVHYSHSLIEHMDSEYGLCMLMH